MFAFWIASWNGIDDDRSVYEISLSKIRIQGIPRVKLLIVSRKEIFVINDDEHSMRIFMSFFFIDLKLDLILNTLMISSRQFFNAYYFDRIYDT